tara:strand:- start:308 stop:856 length:549 start_codon:yes stop_codon:yes gene_type:complete
MSDEYNGWTNRETWCMSLWLDNDRGMYSCTQAATARGLIRAADFANEFPEVTVHVYRHVAIELEDMVQEWRDDLEEFPGSTNGRDFVVRPHPLLSMFLEVGSFWRIDWDQIATGKLDLFPVELLQPKKASDLVRSERPLGAPVPTCPDCDLGVIFWDDDDWHFCDWQPVAVDVLGLEFDHVA